MQKVKKSEALIKMNLLSEKNSLVRWFLPFCLVALLSLSASAQEDELLVRRGNCMPDLVASEGAATDCAGSPRRLPAINTHWDPSRIYRQLVILISFSDTDFSMSDPLSAYKRMFNEDGYNQRQGVGCVAEYFRSQSSSMFNLQFDVYGPYQVSSKAQPIENPTANTKNYGKDALREGAQQFLAENPNIDLSPYDWNGDGSLEQVIFIYAGYTGNQSSTKVYGHIWPNTSSFSTITASSGHRISSYSASAELWANNASCGIGTICHEFSHSLGLPDIYPTTNGWTYSVVDEWDLMDGGNFTNYGWCPPNYTALEKYLMGWLSFTELDKPTTVVGLKPLSEGGEAYVVKHTDNEYLLLENRQWTGWDAGIPAKGLVAYHVNYIASSWKANTPNNTANKPNFVLMSNDNYSYEDWTTYLQEQGVTSQNAIYQNPNRMNSWYFSNASFPWAEGDVLSDSLTNLSTPATMMYNNNAEGSKFLSKPITNIKMTAEGLISFDFMGGNTPTAICEVTQSGEGRAAVVYDLNGHRQQAVKGRKGICIVRQSDGTIVKKVLK